MEGNNSKAVTVFTVFVLIISILSVGVFYWSTRTLFSTISGYVTSTGEANLTVETVVIINFTTNAITWGSGRVNSGASSAGLNTNESNNVTGGNWTLTTPGGLRLINLGNVNLTLNLSATKSAATFIGGTAPIYRWNVTNVEASSCLNNTGGTDNYLPINAWYNPNTTTTQFCGRFQFIDSADSIRIDFNLSIPSDSFTGVLTDTITATAFASA